MSWRRATNFIENPLDGSFNIDFSTLVECNYIPDDRSEILTREIDNYHTHLNSVAKHIPLLDREALLDSKFYTCPGSLRQLSI